MSRPAAQANAARWLGQGGLFVFAWSLPLSLFGMQLGVVLMATAWLLDKERGVLETPVHRAVVYLVAAICLSLLLAPGQPRSFAAATSFWVFAAFWTSYRQLQLTPRKGLLLGGIVGGAVVAAALGLYQAASGNYPLFELMHGGMDPRLRLVPNTERAAAVGFFFSRLTFAHVLLFPLCWAVALAWQQRRVKLKVAWGGAAVLLAAGLWTTWTRAAPIAAAAALAFFLLERLQGRRRLAALGVLVVVGAAVLAASPFLRHRLAKSFAGKSDWTRLTIWHAAVDLANANPLTGIGYGNFKRDARPLIEARTHQAGWRKFAGVVAWAHDNLLTFLAETGLLGALAYCMLFVVFFRVTGPSRRHGQDPPEMGAALASGGRAAVLAFLLVGLFHDNFFDGEVAFNLWFCLAAALATGAGLPTQHLVNTSENPGTGPATGLPTPGTDPAPSGTGSPQQLVDTKADSSGTGPGAGWLLATGVLEACCWGVLLLVCLGRSVLAPAVALVVMAGALVIIFSGRGGWAVGMLLAGLLVGDGPWMGRGQMLVVLAGLLLAVPVAFWVGRRQGRAGAAGEGEIARQLATGLAVTLLAVWTLVSASQLLLAWRSVVDFQVAGLQILPISTIIAGLLLVGSVLGRPARGKRAGVLEVFHTAPGRIAAGAFLVAMLHLAF